MGKRKQRQDPGRSRCGPSTTVRRLSRQSYGAFQSGTHENRISHRWPLTHRANRQETDPAETDHAAQYGNRGQDQWSGRSGPEVPGATACGRKR